jgi:hypothetical protein
LSYNTRSDSTDANFCSVAKIPRNGLGISLIPPYCSHVREILSAAVGVGGRQIFDEDDETQKQARYF